MIPSAAGGVRTKRKPWRRHCKTAAILCLWNWRFGLEQIGFTNICELLGVDRGYRAVVIGAGNLGNALVKSPMFEKRGVDVVAMFDVDEHIVGKKIGEISIFNMDMLETYIKEFAVDIAILTLPKEFAAEVSERLANMRIKGIWNFTGNELHLGQNGIVVENVHIGDSLMTLCYRIARDNTDGE